MFKQSTSLLTVLACFLVLLSCACAPCDEPGVITIDPSDVSAPDLYWQVTTTSYNLGGVSSSIRFINDPVANINMTTSEVVELVLIAENNLSGIKWMDLEGGFGFTCSSASQAISFSGIVPGERVFFDFAEMTCGAVEGNYPTFTIDGLNLCTGQYPILNSGGYGLNGTAATNNDQTGLAELTVTVTGSPL